MTLDIAAIKARADKVPEILVTHCSPWYFSMDGVKDANQCWMFKGTGALDGLLVELANYASTARTDIPGLIAALEVSESARVKAEQALWELDAVGCDFGYYEQAAKTMKSIVDKAIDGLLKQPSILTSTEQKAQGKRCSCGGADDYCVCQNSPDKTTISKRITALEAERDALKEALKMPDADRRQWLLSELVATKGYFNRVDLCEAFGISIPQASTDIRRFLTAFPGLVEYDKTAKRYARRALESKP